MARTLLVVDDIKSNRVILKSMLGNEYNVLEAAHGQEALAIMNREYKSISAILLDLGMPVMDGFSVLEYMRKDEQLSQIPVIVMTGQTDADSEVKALALGAKDYIAKPYKSAIVKQRIWNTINLRETAATVNALKRDRLTGLYNREAFFEKVAEMTAKHEPGYYVMTSFDIDRFKVINDQYGTERGDEILKYIARVFNEGFEHNEGICCRITADHFAALYPAPFQHSSEIAEMRRKAAAVDGIVAPVKFSIGRYAVNDLTITPSAMYDRAVMAASTIKGQFDVVIANYEESMRDTLIQEQKIVTDMQKALDEHQFEAWLQPQYNHSTGALIGAEALVRWRHPEKGLISPGVFIPIFEQNGFIYELDKYIWEDVCKFLREEIDNGLSPLPISVNISRHDVFRPDLVDFILGLVKKYDISVDLLRLEITESAFAESTKQIVSVVKKLISFGFTLEIDDFGSGYSSLNTLKSVPAQVVKLDMRFLEGEDDSERGGNIIESIVRMTKWLGMSVIAEGVEKREQADFLKSIGCNYVQGYLYAKPMPKDEYRKLSDGIVKEEKLLTIKTVDNLDNNSFWDPQSMDSLVFNSYVGAACVFEFYNGHIEILRVTEKYMQLTSKIGLSLKNVMSIDWASYLSEDSKKAAYDSIMMSSESKKEVSGDFLFVGLPGCPYEVLLHSIMRVIAVAGKRILVYCISENMTAQREAEQKERRISEQLKTVMNDMPGGYSRIRIFDDGSLKPDYINDRMIKITGMSREKIMRLSVEDILAGIHSDDRPAVRATIAKMIRDGEAQSDRYRYMRHDGNYIWLKIFGRTTRDQSGNTFLNIYYNEAT